MEQEPLGSPRSFEPRRHQQRTSGWGQAPSTSLGLHSRHRPTSFCESTRSVRPRVALRASDCSDLLALDPLTDRADPRIGRSNHDVGTIGDLPSHCRSVAHRPLAHNRVSEPPRRCHRTPAGRRRLTLLDSRRAASRERAISTVTCGVRARQITAASVTYADSVVVESSSTCRRRSRCSRGRTEPTRVLGHRSAGFRTTCER